MMCPYGGNIYFNVLKPYDIGIKQPLGFDKSLVMNVSVKDNCFTFEIPLQTASSETSCKHAMFHISEPDGELLQMGKDQKSESSTR